MTALGALNPNLLDFAKRTDPDGKIVAVVEILNETNEILLQALKLFDRIPAELDHSDM